MALVDDILAAPALAGLRRLTQRGGDREVVAIRLAEDFTALGAAPAGSFAVLSPGLSAAATDYRFDMALRLAGLHRVAAVAVLARPPWAPSATAADIAEQAGLALVAVPADWELTALLLAILREAGGTAERAIQRAAQGLAAVRAAARGPGEPPPPDGLAGLLHDVGAALGRPVTLEPASPPPDPDAGSRRCHATVPGSDSVAGHLTVSGVSGDEAVVTGLVLQAAAGVAAQILDAARRARELPIRSASALLTELLISEAVLRQELIDRGRRLGLGLDRWHVATRFEVENLAEAGQDEVARFELLEAAGQSLLQAAAGAGGAWHLCWPGQAIVLIRMTRSDPGPQGARDVLRAARRAQAAASRQFPGLRLRGGVGTPHEGPMGLRASEAEARLALATARSAGRPDHVSAHDVAGVQRMLMEWYASTTARASVRAQLEPLERLGRARAETAIRTLATYLDCQGSTAATARRLHLHRNAVTYRLHQITELLGVDLDDPDERLALHLACRARLTLASIR